MMNKELKSILLKENFCCEDLEVFLETDYKETVKEMFNILLDLLKDSTNEEIDLVMSNIELFVETSDNIDYKIVNNAVREANYKLNSIKSNMDKFGLDKSAFDKTLHINFREGGVPKEGPSAGTVITTAILSFLKNKPVKNTFSSSGEITLLGDVLPVGGLREKCLTAIKNGIKEIYISYDNKNEIEELDVHIKSKLKFIYVNNYIEIYNKLFLN